MRLPQWQRPLQVACIHGGYRPVLASFALPTRTTIPTTQALRPAEASGVVEGRRFASVKSQGAYRIPNKATVAKKLGAKKSGDQFVIPGNIIYKQRGTIWHAGENALRGRDHTIHAAATGYVKYYRDPALHPTRQFIGVAFNKEDTLPYPKQEPRRRKLGLVAHVRKVHEGPRPEISDSGIPNKVLRKAGLWNIEALERRLWNADKRREVKEAQAQRARESKAALAGLPLKAADATPEPVPIAEANTTSAEAVSMKEGTSAYASTDAFAVVASQAVPAVTTKPTTTASSTTKPTGPAPKTPYQPERTRPVTPGEFLQKSWQERRRTKVLLLNPRSYAYTESNAAIGRLASKTMYTPPWKLGGRKSRFRSRRRRAVAKIAKVKADKELVRREKEKERIAEEKKRAARLEKQRVRGAKKAKAAQTAEAVGEEAPAQAQASGAAETVLAEQSAKSVEVKEVESSIATQETAQPVEAKEVEKPVASQEQAQSVEVNETESSVAAQEKAQPVEMKEAEKPVAAQEQAQPVEVKEVEKPIVKAEEKPVVAKESQSPAEGEEGDKPVKS